MQIEILDASSDAEKWLRVLGRLPASMLDVYFWPEWVMLHRFEPGARAILFTYQRADELWVYPFLLQPVSHVGEHALEKIWYDIETAYGYGGPLASTEDADFLVEAHNAFAKWCQRQSVVAEFVRLHPLSQNQRWLDPQVELVCDRKTVSLSLAHLSSDDLPFDKDTCYMLRRAERLGIHVKVYPTHNHFDRFMTIYMHMMDRLGADEYYNFNEDYFVGLRQLVHDAGWLLVAEQGEEWVAAAVFLRGSTWLHYHLSASDPDKRVPGANNQLLYIAAQIGSQHGLERLHLGGGLTRMPNDPLLRFKRSMATDSHSFYIGKRVHNPDVYAYLRELWEQRYPSLVPKYGHRVLCYRYRMPEQ